MLTHLQITRQLPPTTPLPWSDLPELPLSTISNLLLPVYRDLLSFAAVCRSWRTLLRSLSPSLLPSLPPLLLTPSLHLYSPSLLPPSSSSTVPPLLPLYSSSYRCLSSSHGQLLLLPPPGTAPLRPVIVDAVTGTRIDLPPIPTDHERFPYHYATLTAPVRSPSARLLLFFSRFAFLSCRVSNNGRGIWTRHRYRPDISFITRAVPCRNRLFGLNDSAGLIEIEFSSSDDDDDDDDQTDAAARVSKVIKPPHAPSNFDRWHFRPQLVSGSDDQLLLVLFLFENHDETAGFRSDPRARDTEIKIYGLDWSNMEWIEVKQLPNHAIFVDCAGKAPVLCEKPERWGGEGNCVYVTGTKFDDRWMVCSLDERKVRRMRPADVPTSSWPSPIWIYPSLFY